MEDVGTDNSFLGLLAGNFTLTGVSNTGIRTNALVNDSTGSSKSALGVDALGNNATGSRHSKEGCRRFLLSKVPDVLLAFGGRRKPRWLTASKSPEARSPQGSGEKEKSGDG